MNSNYQLLVFENDKEKFSKGKIDSENFGITVLAFETLEDFEEAIEYAKSNNITYFLNETVTAESLGDEENEEEAEENIAFFKELQEGPIAAYAAKVFFQQKEIKNKEIVVAVLDSGFSLYNEDYRDRIIPSEYNFTSSNSMEDNSGHGTQVTSIILETTQDNVKILPIKILEDDTITGSVYGLYQGIMAAVNENVDIINISVSTKASNAPLINTAIEAAKQKGIKIVTAAGNNNEDANNYSPANNPYAITIGALEDDFDIATFSNYGDCVNYYALGIEIPCYNNNGIRTTITGTSGSTASVTALIASLDGADLEYNLNDILDGHSFEEDRQIKILNIFNFYRPNLDGYMIPYKEFEEDKVYASADFSDVSYMPPSDRFYLRYYGNGGTVTKEEDRYGFYTLQIGQTDYYHANASGYPAEMIPGNTYTLNRVMFEKTGYSFSKWTTKSDGTGTSFENNQTHSQLNGTAGSTVKLYAQWTPNEYTVTFNLNGGNAYNPTSATSTVTMVYDKSNNRVVRCATRTGYVFAGWYTAASGGTKIYTPTNSTQATAVENTTYFKVNSSGTNVWKGTSNVTFYAHWTPITYYVQYNGNGGTIQANTASFGDFITLPVGSTSFYHWNTQKGYKIPLTYDSEYTTNNNRFTRTGYTFANWNTKANGSGTTYIGGTDKFKNLASTQDAEGQLYAQWTPKTYTITFDLNDGDDYLGSDINLSPTVQPIYDDHEFRVVRGAIRTGYIFQGWYDAPTGGTKVYEKETDDVDNRYSAVENTTYWKVNSSGINVWKYDGNLTVYAHWTPKEYTISFDLNGGDAYNPSTVSNSVIETYDQHNNRIVRAAVRDGYTFKGWYTEPSGGIQIYTPTSAAGATAVENTIYWKVNDNGTNVWKGTSDVIFYAQWEPMGRVHFYSTTSESKDCYVYQYITEDATWRRLTPYIYNNSEWKLLN